MADVEMGMSECDLQLRICLAGNDDAADHDPPVLASSTTTTTCTSVRTLELFGESQESEQRKQPITIFYADRVCVCDATEIEAGSVISMAKAEMKAQTMKKRDTQEQRKQPEEKSSSPSTQHSSVGELQVVLKQDQLPIKRSLHRFLEKRKWRLNAASPPYTTRHPSRPSNRSSMAPSSSQTCNFWSFIA